MSKSKLGLSNLNTINIGGLAVVVFMLDKIKHCKFKKKNSQVSSAILNSNGYFYTV